MSYTRCCAVTNSVISYLYQHIGILSYRPTSCCAVTNSVISYLYQHIGILSYNSFCTVTNSVISYLQSRYVNRGVVRVDANVSFHYIYVLFRTLGLSHVIVIGMQNDTIGIITREDMTPYNLKRLARRDTCSIHVEIDQLDTANSFQLAELTELK